MALAPKIEDYDLNILVALGNQECEGFSYDYIKKLIIKKILDIGYTLRFLIFNFVKSEKILKEAYSEVIMIFLKDHSVCIDNILIDELIKYVSLDSLVYYGMESCNLNVVLRCSDEFWLRAQDIEDKNELFKKMRIKKKYKIKKKGDLNDKY